MNSVGDIHFHCLLRRNRSPEADVCVAIKDVQTWWMWSHGPNVHRGRGHMVSEDRAGKQTAEKWGGAHRNWSRAGTSNQIRAGEQRRLLIGFLLSAAGEPAAQTWSSAHSSSSVLERPSSHGPSQSPADRLEGPHPYVGNHCVSLPVPVYLYLYNSHRVVVFTEYFWYLKYI